MGRFVAGCAGTGVRRSLLAALGVCLLLVGVCVAGAQARELAASGEAPSITQQPVSVAVLEGQPAVFEASASGSPTPTIQWELLTPGSSTWTIIAKATSEKFTITSVKLLENGDQFRATFKNSKGTATTQAATLTDERAPTVSGQPANAVVEEGQNAVFEARAFGAPQPTVQWETSTDGGATWAPVEGATNNQLTVADPVLAQTGAKYRAVFTNAVGKATSNAATLTVAALPKVTEQPVATTAEVGQSVSFESAATGLPAPTVQWESSTDNGNIWSVISGATSDLLTIVSPTAEQNGEEYRATFTNTVGHATSAAATLTVSLHHYATFGWGLNSSGQLGDGNTSQSNAPITVSGLHFVTAVAAGRRHSLALLAGGTVEAWGSNLSGQLGTEEGNFSDVPVPVEGLSGVTAIAAGVNFSLALMSNGTVEAWGANESGQLGDGNNLQHTAPVVVSGLSDVTAIAAGGEHALALLGDGTVEAWGENEFGQLGNHRTSNSNEPVEVLGGATAIAAGDLYSLALMSGGSVTAWGNNAFGQLGNPDVTEAAGEEDFSDAPVPVTGLSGVSAIAAGDRHSLALLGDGTVDAWGEDEQGELGDGVLMRASEEPAAVSGLSGVTAVAAGSETSLALLGNGRVMSWGIAKHGELGNGSAGEPSDVPVLVSGLGGVAGIAAGGSHDMAFGEPIPVVAEVSPNAGPASGGNSVNIAGVNLSGATAVKFGTIPATSFSVNADGSISAVAPAGALGTVDVTVTTPTGTSAPVLADRYSYRTSPVVQKLSVKLGTAAGGTSVTIAGVNLEGATAVSFGSAAATGVIVNSGTSVTAISPPGIGGVVDVTVTTPLGTSATSKKDNFKYIPAVTGIAASSGPAGGGTAVTVSGAGFALGAGASSFKFGTKQATAVNCASSTSCTMLTPAHPAGVVQVIATVAKAKSPTAAGDQFTYE